MDEEENIVDKIDKQVKKIHDDIDELCKIREEKIEEEKKEEKPKEEQEEDKDGK